MDWFLGGGGQIGIERKKETKREHEREPESSLLNNA